MATTSSTLSGLSRRRLLRASVTVGAGTGLVLGGGAEYATTADTVEVEYALVRSAGGGRSLTPRRKRVPAEWHASAQAAFAAQRKLQQLALSPLAGSFVVPGSFDEPTASISVGATDERVGEAVSEAVPDGVEIDLTVWDEIPPKPEPDALPDEPFQVADLDGRSIPGGVHCSSPVMNGTLAPSARDASGGRRFFLTSNHVFGGAGTKETEHRGRPLALADDDEERTIGRVERGYPEADFVRVAPVDGYRPTPRIAGADSPRVVGQFTRIGLADLAARGGRLEKFGAFSGHTSGRILGIDGFTCFVGEVCKPGQLLWGGERAITDGDSGSVNYAPDPEHPDENVIVGGINNARSWWPGADFTWGTAAFHLLEGYGVHF